MNVLITGMSGLLGRYLFLTRPRWITELWGTYRHHPVSAHHNMVEMELADLKSIVYAFNKSTPDIVIHCAGEGDVDRCQEEPESVRDLICGASLDMLLHTAEEHKSKIVYLSSNAVFDGEHPPYSEKDGANPTNRYGSMKAMAEYTVLDYLDHLIIRPILLYGWGWSWGRMNWMERLWEHRNSDRVWRIVSDRFTQPTSAHACAAAIWALLGQERTGIYHVGGNDVMSLYDFCTCIACKCGMDESRIIPAVSSDFPGIAPRPRDTHYDLSKLESCGIKPVGVREGLDYYLEAEEHLDAL